MDVDAQEYEGFPPDEVGVPLDLGPCVWDEVEETSGEGFDFAAVEAYVQELREFLSNPAEETDEGSGDELPHADDAPEGAEACRCGYPDPGEFSLAHVLMHNADEVAGAVSVDWSGADNGVGYPVPCLWVVKDVLTGVRLRPVRVTILCDEAANLAVADITELLNADGEPIRSNTRGKLPVHTEEYKAWNNRGEKTDAFQGDRYVTRISRFILASTPVAP